MNHIIALKQSSSKGKSSTIKALAKLFIETYPENTNLFQKGDLNTSKDIRLIIAFKINNRQIIIAFDSKGDPGQKLDIRLKENITIYDANIIFTACRSSGDTYNQVKHIGSDHSYNVIFTAPYETNNSDQYVLMNQLKAKHMLQLTKDLNLI